MSTDLNKKDYDKNFECVKSYRFSDDDTKEKENTYTDEVIKEEENTYTDEVIKEEKNTYTDEVIKEKGNTYTDEVIVEKEENTYTDEITKEENIKKPNKKHKTNPLNLKSEVAIRCYKSGKFTEEQLKFIDEYESGENNISLKNHMIMNSVRAGIEGSEHLSPNMSLGQVCMVNKGINKGVDVSSFADKDLSTYQMYESYQGLKRGVNVNDLDDYCNSFDNNDRGSLNNINFSGLQKRQLRKAMQQGIDIRPFAQGGMNSAKMFLLRRAARKGIAIDTFASPALSIFGTARMVYKHKRAIKANPAAYNSKVMRYNNNHNSNYNHNYNHNYNNNTNYYDSVNQRRKY